MKTAKVTVIFKNSNRNDFFNYRSTSILPVSSEALEKMIYKRINAFCEENAIITSL